MKKWIIRILVITFVFNVFTLAIVAYSGYVFYKSVFRLSYEQIHSTLRETNPVCVKFSECKLEPGDILIRRYITHVSDLFSKTLNPYFTHSAVYLGNDELFEALGNYLPPKDQIQITKLSESDWLDEEMENFVVVRPKNYNNKLDTISSNLREIANNPDYVFGILDENKKTASCSDVILKQLVSEGVMVESSAKPWVITPDYLFWKSQASKESFEVVGYSVSNKKI